MKFEKKRHMPSDGTVTITLSYTFNLDEFVIDTLPEDCDHCPVGYRCNHDIDDYSKHVDCGIVRPIESGHRPDSCKLKSIEQYLDEQRHQCKDCDHCVPIPMSLGEHCGWYSDRLAGMSMCTHELKVVNPGYGCCQFTPKPPKEPELVKPPIPMLKIDLAPYEALKNFRVGEGFPDSLWEAITPSFIAHSRLQQLKLQHGVCCATCRFCQFMEPQLVGPNRIISVDVVPPRCTKTGITIGNPKANVCDQYLTAHQERQPHFNECHCVNCVLFTDYQGSTGKCAITGEATDAGQGACENFLPDGM